MSEMHNYVVQLGWISKKRNGDRLEERYMDGQDEWHFQSIDEAKGFYDGLEPGELYRSKKASDDRALPHLMAYKRIADEVEQDGGAWIKVDVMDEQRFGLREFKDSQPLVEYDGFRGELDVMGERGMLDDSMDLEDVCETLVQGLGNSEPEDKLCEIAKSACSHFGIEAEEDEIQDKLHFHLFVKRVTELW